MSQATIGDKMAHLKELRRQRDKLWRDLDRSMEIQSLWPEAFEHGSVKTKMSDPGWHKPLSQQRLIITNAVGETKEFKLSEVSIELVEPHIPSLTKDATDRLISQLRRIVKQPKESIRE